MFIPESRVPTSLQATTELLSNKVPNMLTEHNETIKFIYSEKATKFFEIHQLFDWQYIGQVIVGDFVKLYGLLRIFELYLK